MTESIAEPTTNSKLRSHRWSLVAGGSLILLGITVSLGWLFRQPALIQLLPSADGMPYATAIGFVLAGALLVGASLPPHTRTSAYRLGLQGLATLLILLGLGALAEWDTSIRLGLSPEPQAVQRWFADPNPFVGRMRPLAALGFMAVGAIGFLIPRAGRTGAYLVAQSLALLVLFIGGTGVLGHLVGFGTVFGWYLGPVLAAGAGFIVCGFGLILLVGHSSGSLRDWAGDESGKVSLVAGAVVVATGLSGLLGGFAVLYPEAVGELHRNLALSLAHRSDSLESAIQHGWLDAQNFGNQPLRLSAMRRLNDHPTDRQARDEIQAVAERYRAFGFSGVVFEDASGRRVARAGSFVAAPDLRVALATPSPSQLLWQQGYVLQAQIDMIEDGRRVGRLLAERRLAVGNGLLASEQLGASIDFAVCAWVTEKLDCFPLRSTQGKVLHQLSPDFAGRPLPMRFALEGKTGIVQTTDYRGVQVIAAHQPLGNLGLGTVLKIDAAELYQPIARRLGTLLAMLFVVASAAVVLVRIQVVPLVGAMDREIEERKRAQATQLRLSASLRRLSEIAALAHLPLLERFHRALAVGAEQLGLEFGIVSNIDGERYEVVAQVSPPGTLADGQVFPFGATYCSITLAENAVVAIDNMAESTYLGHPCYREFKLETYIGGPIVVGGQVYGTVNFSSPKPFSRPFDEGDREFVALLARWAGSAIERHRTNEVIRQSERRVRALLDATDESVMLLAPDGKILAINAFGAQRFGEAPAMLEGKDFFALLPADLSAQRRATLDQSVVTGEPIHSQDQRQGIYFDNNLYPVQGETGEVESIAVYAKDVTENHRNKQVEDIFHHLDTALLKWQMEMEAVAQMFCDELLPVFGLAAAWIGKAENDGQLMIIGSAGAGGVSLDHLRQPGLRWSEGASYCQPVDALIHDGQRRKLNLVDPCCSTCYAGAKVGASSGLLLPLTVGSATWGVLALYGRQQDQFDGPQRALDAIASRLGSVLESAQQQEWLVLLESALADVSNAVMIADANARILWANRALTELTGYSADEILGKTPKLFSSGSQDAAFYHQFWETLASGQAWRGELVNAWRDGTRYTVNQTVTPLLDANGQVSHYVAIVEDISERKAMEARVQHAAQFDPLTDLPNRSLFFDRLAQALAQARRDDHKVALLFLDLDRFKEVNDTLGHDAGDLLLKSVAERLTHQMRKSDTVARLAGDEFTVILPGAADVDSAENVAEKIIAALACPFTLGESQAHIGVSIGIALFPDHGEDVEQVLSAADKAMYLAKASGRNTVRVYGGFKGAGSEPMQA